MAPLDAFGRDRRGPGLADRGGRSPDGRGDSPRDHPTTESYCRPLRNGAPTGGSAARPPYGPLDPFGHDRRGPGLADRGRGLWRELDIVRRGSAGSGTAHRRLGIREEPDGRSPGRLRTRRPGVRLRHAGFAARRSRDRLVPRS